MYNFPLLCNCYTNLLMPYPVLTYTNTYTHTHTASQHIYNILYAQQLFPFSVSIVLTIIMIVCTTSRYNFSWILLYKNINAVSFYADCDCVLHQLLHTFPYKSSCSYGSDMLIVMLRMCITMGLLRFVCRFVYGRCIC